jgi:hypothetical protein
MPAPHLLPRQFHLTMLAAPRIVLNFMQSCVLPDWRGGFFLLLHTQSMHSVLLCFLPVFLDALTYLLQRAASLHVELFV